MFILSDIFTSCDWKFISYIHVDPESENENHNKCIFAESRRLRFIFGSVLYADYVSWNVAERFYIRRIDVQTVTISARCV